MYQAHPALCVAYQGIALITMVINFSEREGVAYVNHTFKFWLITTQ